MPRNTQLQNVGGSDGNLGPLDFQIFIRAKANIKEGNAQLCMYTEIQSGAQLLKQRQNMHDSNFAQISKYTGNRQSRFDAKYVRTFSLQKAKNATQYGTYGTGIEDYFGIT